MNHLGELLSVYLDGSLDPEERRQVLRHLGECGVCMDELVELAEVRAAVRGLPQLDLPPVLQEAFRDLPAQPPSSRRAPLRVGAAAAVAAAVLAAMVLLQPDPVTVTMRDLSAHYGARVSLDPAFSPAKAVTPVDMTSPGGSP